MLRRDVSAREKHVNGGRRSISRVPILRMSSAATDLTKGNSVFVGNFFLKISTSSRGRSRTFRDIFDLIGLFFYNFLKRRILDSFSKKSRVYLHCAVFSPVESREF